MPKRVRIALWGAAIVVLLIVALTIGQKSYLGELVRRAGETGPPVTIQDLSSIDTLQQAFDAGAGSTRLILLVSPT